MLARLVSIFAIVAGAVSAQNADTEDGRDLFLYFCAECHGKDGASVGPMAEMLAIVPPNLAVLSKQNAGVFPIESVAMQIDGRIPIEGHSFMPVFGPALDGDQFISLSLPSGQPMMVTQRLANLITYLQAIQE